MRHGRVDASALGESPFVGWWGPGPRLLPGSLPPVGRIAGSRTSLPSRWQLRHLVTVALRQRRIVGGDLLYMQQLLPLGMDPHVELQDEFSARPRRVVDGDLLYMQQLLPLVHGSSSRLAR